MKHIAIIAALALSACGNVSGQSVYASKAGHGIQGGEGYALLLDMVVTSSSDSSTR